MAAQRQAAITTEAASRIGMTDTPIVPDAAVAARSRLLRPEIMAPRVLGLVSDATTQKRRAALSGGSLGHLASSGRSGGKVASKSSTTPIEPD